MAVMVAFPGISVRSDRNRQKTAKDVQLRIKYLVENGKPLAIAVEDAADLESTRRIELLFFLGVLCGGFLLFGRSTWRASRRWRTTPGAGL
jgi:hypothetical protein